MRRYLKHPFPFASGRRSQGSGFFMELMMGSRVSASMLLSTYVHVDAEGVNGFGSITCRGSLFGSSRLNTIKRNRSHHLETSYTGKLCCIARCEIFHSWYRRRV